MPSVRVARATVAVALAAAVVALTGPAAAAVSVTLPTAVESWYQAGGAAAGAPTAPPPANPYGAGTLHVGVRAGVEDARTYVRLDTAALPSAADVLAARLVLPIDPGHGTTSP